MTQAFFAQLLILILLLLPALHVFSQNKEKSRSAALCSSLAVFTTVFAILAYGLSMPFFLLLLVSIMSCVLTLRSFVRFVMGLAVVHTGRSYFSAVIQLLLVGSSILFCFLFRPVPVPQELIKNAPVMEEETFLVDYNSSQLMPEYAKATVEMTVLRPKNMGPAVPVLLYVPDIFSDAQSNFATAYMLTQKGFAVAMPFFAWGDSFLDIAYARFTSNAFLNRFTSIFFLDYFNQNYKDTIVSKRMEFEYITHMLKNKILPESIKHRDVYLLVDGTVRLANILASVPEMDFKGTFIINSIHNKPYIYEAGYGNLGVYHPFEAYLRGYSIVQDKEWETPQLIAEKILEDYNELFGIR